VPIAEALDLRIARVEPSPRPPLGIRQVHVDLGEPDAAPLRQPGGQETVEALGSHRLVVGRDRIDGRATAVPWRRPPVVVVKDGVAAARVEQHHVPGLGLAQHSTHHALQFVTQDAPRIVPGQRGCHQRNDRDSRRHATRPPAPSDLRDRDAKQRPEGRGKRQQVARLDAWRVKE